MIDEFKWLVRGGLLFPGALIAAGLAVLLLLVGSAGIGGAKLFWWGAAVAAGLVLGTAISRRGARTAGMLTFLLFAGGAAQLWLTQPHWFPSVSLRLRGAMDLAMVVLVALQGALAIVALRQAIGPGFVGPGFRKLGPGRLSALILVAVLFSVSAMDYVGQSDPVGYLVHALAGGAFAVIGMLSVAAILTAPDLDRALPSEAELDRLSAALPLGLSLLTVVISSVMALWAFDAAPQVEDEVAYLFQARTFSHFTLTAPALPAGVAASFDYYLLRAGTTIWYAVTAPGWPAVLAVGALFGLEWLINPLLGGLAVWLGHRVTERVAGRARADLVALLMATSPWLLATSASLMTHALGLVLVLAGWLCMLRAKDLIERGKSAEAAVWSFVTGVLFGWLFLTRALEALLIGVLTGIWALWGLKARIRPIITYVLGALVIGNLQFFYNFIFTGKPLKSPQDAYLAELWGPGANAFGFGPDIGPPGGWSALDLYHGHSPIEALINTLNGIASLNLELFGWVTGSVVLLMAAMLWPLREGFGRMMAVVLLLVVGVHALYWYGATFYIGPRYWYAAFFAVVYLSASGAVGLARRLGDGAGPRVMAGVVILCLFGLTVFTPWRAVMKYAPRASATVALRAEAAAEQAAHQGDGRVIYLLRDAEHLDAVMADNHPYLPADRPIFAFSPDAATDAALMAAFPGRRSAVLNGPKK